MADKKHVDVHDEDEVENVTVNHEETEPVETDATEPAAEEQAEPADTSAADVEAEPDEAAKEPVEPEAEEAENDEAPEAPESGPVDDEAAPVEEPAEEAMDSEQPAAAPTGPKTPEAAAPRQPRARRTAGLVILAVVAIVILVLVVVFVKGATNPTRDALKVSDTFMHDAKAQHTADAYALTSVAFQQSTPEKQLDAMLRNVAPQIQAKPALYGKKYIGGSIPQTVVEYVTSSKSGKVYTKFILIKFDGKWQVFSVSFNPAPVDLTGNK